MYRFLLLLSSCLLFCSCQMDSTVQTKLQVIYTATPDSRLLAETKEKILLRLHKNGFREASLKEGPDATRFTIVAELNASDEKEWAHYHAQFDSNEFGMWDTYSIEDSELIDWLDSLPEVPSFEYNRNASLGMFPKAVLGACHNADSLAITLDTLQNHFKAFANLKLLWGEKEEKWGAYGKKVRHLYMINTKGQKVAPISHEDMHRSAVVPNEYTGGFQVDFKLNDEGAGKWHKMTELASAEGNKAVALVMNKQVYSAPRVVSPISNGSCSMTGDESEDEMLKLAAALTNGPLPYPVEILAEKVLDE